MFEKKLVKIRSMNETDFSLGFLFFSFFLACQLRVQITLSFYFRLFIVLLFYYQIIIII